MPRRDYARITGRPRLVMLGGREYSVPKMSPAILGELDSWLRTQVVNPQAEARLCLRECPHLSEDVQRAIWLTATEASKDYPPRYSSPRGQELIFDTHEGTSRLLYALLRRTQPGFSLDDAGELAEALEENDVPNLLEAISASEVGDPTTGEDSPSNDPEAGYEKARAWLAKEYGWTFDVIDEMGFDAIDSALRQGKPTEGIEVESEEQIADVAKNWRKYYQGL